MAVLREGAMALPQENDGLESGELVRLNLPRCDLPIRDASDGRSVFDAIRRKFVRLTPEEWVRQHFLRYLTDHRHYPAALIAVEMGFRFQGMMRRADIVVHGRQGAPFLLIECKAPDVKIVQATFDQVSSYNRVVEARFLAVTNGLKHFCWRIDSESGRYEFLDGLPRFDDQEPHDTTPE